MFIYVRTDRSCSSEYDKSVEYLFVLRLDGMYLILNDNVFVTVYNRWCYPRNGIYVQLVGDILKVFDKLEEDIRINRYFISDYVITRILKLLPYLNELKQYADEITEKIKNFDKIINDVEKEKREIINSAKYEINIDSVALVKKAIN
jgi:hypothetical protein